MSLSRIVLFVCVAVLGVIGLMGVLKKIPAKKAEKAHQTLEVLAKRVELPSELETIKTVKAEVKIETLETTPVRLVQLTENKEDDFPDVDRIDQLFRVNGAKFPIVETIDYTSRVAWLKGRPAWIADYASYYNTSRHFIARSLNGKPDYLTQQVSTGSRFNVFRKDKNIHFYLLVDLSRCKMALYYVDLDAKERALIKTYSVGVGRIDQTKASGYLTPTGTYSLGNKIAVYKQGTMGYFLDEKVEMVRVYGTRWIPFDQEVEACTEHSKGYGIHGAPWEFHPKTKQLIENHDGIGKQFSDGSISLSLEDIEELFSIVITKPAYVVIVRDFKEAKLPGVEVPL